MKFKRIYIEITNICNLKCSFCSNSKRNKKEMSIDEFELVMSKITMYTDYIYLHVKGETLSHHYLDDILSICKKYNKIYKDELPNITPHICRHTFCSNMAKAGMNPKTLQMLMGHANIGITLNTYTHVDFTDIQREMEEVSKKEL